ncbi:hypothetical protein Dvina_17580 [Dactylosporangium vinaceum]|uniref:Secreted protein n=1 Tax=Dactylosporangium vinaceum TaxID=53362 RepID=A0ABV5M3D4_9ACTN|nr:hypothetical protein [Dactylosporangium vinaceum]UAB99712.1 hypothetical protein Dvina_17580 [Dactylosporangium vinaceum]
MSDDVQRRRIAQAATMRFFLRRRPLHIAATGSAFLVSAVLGATTGVVPAHGETAGMQSGDRVVAARFRDRCDGGSEVQLFNPYQAAMVVEVNGEPIVVDPQQRPWHTATAGGRDRTVELQIFDPATDRVVDGLIHRWSPPSSCDGSDGAKVPGQSRLSVQDNGVADGDSIVAALFRDGCAASSSVQLPNPYASDLVFDVNGERVAVGPHQQPWHATSAVGRGRNRSVVVLIEDRIGASDSITHRWTSPTTCASTATRAG